MVECGRRVDQSGTQHARIKSLPWHIVHGCSVEVPHQCRDALALTLCRLDTGGWKAGVVPRQAHEGGVDRVEGCVMGEEPIDQSVKGRVRHWGRAGDQPSGARHAP